MANEITSIGKIKKVPLRQLWKKEDKDFSKWLDENIESEVGYQVFGTGGNINKIHKFIEKPKPGETDSHWVNAGIYYLKPSIFDAIPNKYGDFGRDIFPMLLRNNVPLYGVCSEINVKAFDTPEMLIQNTKTYYDAKK